MGPAALALFARPQGVFASFAFLHTGRGPPIILQAYSTSLCRKAYCMSSALVVSCIFSRRRAR